MKKKFLIPIVLTIFTASTITYALTIGIEPPVQYINNLKTCTKSSIKINETQIQEYTIKGKLPNGRCEVYISSYTNFADPKVYENFKTVAKSFAGMANDLNKNTDIPTQTQMIEQGLKEKDLSFEHMDKILNHVKSGMCTQIF